MNKPAVKKLTYHFQDLVTQKNIKTFKKFLAEVFEHFKMTDVNRISQKFIYKELRNIYTFLKIIQHHPNSYLLAQALKPLFRILLEGLVIPKIVYVGDEKFYHISKIKYSDLVIASRGKRVVQKEKDCFLIPYNGVAVAHPVNFTVPFFKNWVCVFIGEILADRVERSLMKYGGGLSGEMQAWSKEQSIEFGERLSVDYLSSEENYLPRELFDFNPE